MVSQISQSRRRSLTLTLENWCGHFSRTVSLFSRSFGKLFTSFRSHKFVIILFVILRSFGVFISAKCCGSFNKFFRSLDSSFFFRKWIFYMCSTFFLLTQDFQLPSLFLPAHQILQMEIFEMPWGNDFIAAGLDCVNHCSIAVATSLRRLKSVHVMLCFEAITSMTSTLSY